jgi:RimJ/RimL family protein N-acetyltransferase
MLEIVHAHPNEREEIAQFMQDSFPRAKWPRSGWDALLSGRWSEPGDSYAITVRDAGKLIGVLGLVTATRQTTNGLAKTSNMSSWYVDKTYRGQGVGRKMLELATADPEITITNFSSARGAVPLIERAGFSELDSERSIWRPSGGSVRLPVNEAPLLLGEALCETDRRTLADHAGLDLKTVAVETPDGHCVLVMSVKQKHDAYVTYEVMYLGDRALFARHARAIADSILPVENAVLSVDRRFVSPNVVPDARECIAVPRFYTAGRMPAEDVDHLYSEIVLLNLKMY